MAKPRAVKVGQMTYKVIYQRDMEEFADDDAPVVWGICEHPTQRIVIASDTGTDFQKDTLLHEVLHAACYASGLAFDDDQEEYVVYRLSSVLLGVLRENPELVEYLSKHGA